MTERRDGSGVGAEAARRALAERVRAHCLFVAEEAYEYAGIKGMCAEGRWAYALDAMRSATLDDLAAESVS
jgi:hypothetical protein